MGNATEHEGIIIGHMVQHRPEKIEERGHGITVTKAEKLSASVIIQVDDLMYRIVPCRESELILKGKKPSAYVRKTVYDAVVERHPLSAERKFNEIAVKKGGSKPHYIYRLEE